MGIRILLVLALVFIGFWILIGIIGFFRPHSSGPRNTYARVQADQRTFATGIEMYNIDFASYPVTGKPQTLTTPIAYLSKIVGDDYSIDYEEGQLAWIIPEQFRKKKPEPLPMGYFSSGTQYLVYSRGPNKVFDIDPNRDLPLGEAGLKLLQYDPTNGSVSPGDVWRLGGTP